MGELVLTVTVEGKVEPRGSKDAFPLYRDRKLKRPVRRPGNVTCEACGETDGGIIINVTDANPQSTRWMQEVEAVVRKVLGERDGPLIPKGVGATVEAIAFLHRPEGHWRGAHLREDAPALPVVRPDADKLLRGTLDAMTGLVWADDGQTTDVTTRKRYAVPDADGEPLRCEIRVWLNDVERGDQLPADERRRERPLAIDDELQASLLGPM